MNDPAIASVFAGYGIDQYAHGHEHFEALINEAIQKWRKLGADTGFTID